MLPLAEKIPWAVFDEAFAKRYSKDAGAPAKPIRLMVGLLLLKQLEDLSDEVVVLQWKRNPYYQVFCGMTEFQQSPPVIALSWLNSDRELAKWVLNWFFK